MPEQTLNSQLSGTEVINAILDKVRWKLERDCNLNKNSAYDFFKATIHLDISLHDTGANIPIKGELEVNYGMPVEDADDVLASVVIDEASPNSVRVETGQGVPTLTKGPNGESLVQHVKYARGKEK